MLAVPRELESLQSAVKMLEDRVEALAHKLAPVVVSEPPSEATSGAESGRPTCELSDALSNISSAILAQCGQLGQLRDRCQL